MEDGIETERIDLKPSVEIRAEKIDTLEQELNRYKKRYNLLLQVGLLLVGLGLFVTLVAYLSADIRRFFDYSVKPIFFRFWPSSLGVIVIFLVGFNLYFFKHFLRRYYGIAEVIFGLSLGWYAISKATTTDRETTILPIVVAIYLVGRGLRNSNFLLREREDIQKKDSSSS